MAHTITVVRHTESVGNKRNVFSGWRDFDLSPEGQQLAAEVAKKLAKESFDLAFTSHLKRAYGTALSILKYHPKTPLIVDNRLAERHYGRLQGFSKSLFAKEHPVLYPIFHRSYDTPPPEGESEKMVEQRVLSFIHDLLLTIRFSQADVLIAAHGNSIRPMRRYFEDLSPKEMMAQELPFGGILQYKVTEKILADQKTYERIEDRLKGA